MMYRMGKAMTKKRRTITVAARAKSRAWMRALDDKGRGWGRGETWSARFWMGQWEGREGN
jgi:hypothetical protein